MKEQCLGAPTHKHVLLSTSLSAVDSTHSLLSQHPHLFDFVCHHHIQLINQKWLFAFCPLSSSLMRIFNPRACLIHVPPLQSRLPTPCQLTPWSNWSTCAYTDGVGGWQSQSRTMMQQAINADSCDEFLLVRNRSCTFDPYSVCGGQEKWFNLNSGQDVSRCVCVLSHWVHAVIVEVPDLPSLKCSSQTAGCL